MHQKEQNVLHSTIPPGMTEEQYKDAIRTSANKVLQDLLDRPDHDIRELTVRQHRVKLLTWKVSASSIFCCVDAIKKRVCHSN
jgi:hypothetical protein